MRGAHEQPRENGRAGLALGALVACAVAWCGSPAAAAARHEARETHAKAAGEDFHWSWHIAAGKAIEIKGVNGDIHARTASGGDVEVTATKHARRSDPTQVRIEVIEHEGGVTVCAVYPGGRWGKPNECEVGARNHSHVDDNDVVVDFEVRVPVGVSFVGRTVNGGIEAEGLHGPVEANTVNGSIGLSTGGTARASTVNGSIVAALGSASWKGNLGFSTVNGGIELDFPPGLSTEVHAETLNGEIISDFPMTVGDDHVSRRSGIRVRLNRRRISGTVGSGGGGLSLSTVNGDIRLSSSQ